MEGASARVAFRSVALPTVVSASGEPDVGRTTAGAVHGPHGPAAANSERQRQPDAASSDVEPFPRPFPFPVPSRHNSPCPVGL